MILTYAIQSNISVNERSLISNASAMRFVLPKIRWIPKIITLTTPNLMDRKNKKTENLKSSQFFYYLSGYNSGIMV